MGYEQRNYDCKWILQRVICNAIAKLTLETTVFPVSDVEGAYHHVCV